MRVLLEQVNVKLHKTEEQIAHLRWMKEWIVKMRQDKMIVD